MSSSYCKNCLQTLFDSAYFGLDFILGPKHSQHRYFWDRNLFQTKKCLFYQHAWWNNKNSGLTILGAQIYLGPKILIAQTNFQPQYLPTNCLDQEDFGGPTCFLEPTIFQTQNLFWPKKFLDQMLFLGTNFFKLDSFRTENLLGPVFYFALKFCWTKKKQNKRGDPNLFLDLFRTTGYT